MDGKWEEVASSSESRSVALTSTAAPVIPSMSIDVQRSRILWTFARRRGAGVSGTEALQWTLRCWCTPLGESNQPTSDGYSGDEPSSSVSFSVRALVGPMDVAVVSLLRRTTAAIGPSSPSRRKSGSIMGGPLGAHFRSGGCTVNVKEALFGDPFQCDIALEERMVASKSPDASSLWLTRPEIAMRVSASKVLLACRPDHCGACLQLLEAAAAAAAALSATMSRRAQRNERKRRRRERLLKGSLPVAPQSPTAMQEPVRPTKQQKASSSSSTSSSVAPLTVSYELNAPELCVTLLAPLPGTKKHIDMVLNEDDDEGEGGDDGFRSRERKWSEKDAVGFRRLLAMRWSSMMLRGESPGKGYAAVDRCTVRCWTSKTTPAAGVSDASSGVALFGLATKASSLADSEESGGGGTGRTENEEPSKEEEGGKEERPMLQIDWSGPNSSRAVDDVLAQVRPVFCFASPAVLRDLLAFSSNISSASTSASLSSSAARQNNSAL